MNAASTQHLIFPYVHSMKSYKHMHRPASFADKINDPHLRVCHGGASRLEVCLMIGQLKSEHVMPEVLLTSAAAAFCWLSNIHHAALASYNRGARSGCVASKRPSPDDERGSRRHHRPSCRAHCCMCQRLRAIPERGSTARSDWAPRGTR